MVFLKIAKNSSYFLYRSLHAKLILFFLSTITFRKELFKSVHYFIHLNLSIALLLGYVAFLAGIDTAVGNRVSHVTISITYE